MPKNQELSDFLEHHGVKGMKWGRRKRQPSSTTLRTYRNMQERNLDEARELKKNGGTLEKRHTKALAQHKLARRNDLILASLWGGAAAVVLGPAIKSLSTDLLRMAAYKVVKSREARRGAEMAADILKEIGDKPALSMKLIDGTWKLAR